MLFPIDVLNWSGTRPKVKFPGRVLLDAVLRYGFNRLPGIAGRRLVSAVAGAPAIQLTAGDTGKALQDTDQLVRAAEFTVREMHLDTICMVADLSLEAEACGCQVQYYQRDMPAVLTHPVRQLEDVLSLKIPDPEHEGRMPVILEVMSRLKQKYALIKVATVTGPFTLALQLCGGAIYADAIKDPGKVDGVVKYAAKVVTRYSQALAGRGVDILIIAEPAVSQLSPRLYERFAQPFIKDIAGRVKKPVILHICGKAEHLVKFMPESGCAAFSVDQVDMGRLAADLPRSLILVGNLSPELLRRGTTGEIETKTRELLRQTAARKEMIIAPGCDLAPDTPLENILAFVNTVKNWKNRGTT